MKPNMKRNVVTILLLTALLFEAKADDGYRLWLKYDRITDQKKSALYNQLTKSWIIDGISPTLDIAKKELQLGLTGLLGGDHSMSASTADFNEDLVIGTSSSPIISSLKLGDKLKNVNREGYIITDAIYRHKKVIVIAAPEDIGVLYGVFHFLRLLQTHQDISSLSIESSPKIKLRLLNHWDNLDRTVERGYAGFSIWDWHRLPEYLDQRYYDYARANASIGINGTVLTNVNANALILTPDYLEKVKALADLLRPYGIKVYLPARFSAPMEIGGLKTADPLDAHVRDWWKNKAKEIYSYVPDFGGFIVKANSEGQPGPQNYGRTHAEGANMLAEALQPYHGIVMWRAFVYDANVQVDRAMQAFNEFKPLDGKFNSNVLVQVKNGAVDFQPREPFHPLFGAMPQTPLMMEFQITQEYLGQSTHLVYLSPLFKECMESDTYAKGKGSTVAQVVDGTLDQHSLNGIAGVANIGTDRNWCGHPFGQANWYAFGRLAWDHSLSSEQIADEWIRMTFSNDVPTVKSIQSMMMASREITVDYMTPLGLHHIMGYNHHYGPGPWIKDKPRADWTSVYYHRADSLGVGFDRTKSGSNAISQYAPPLQQEFSSPTQCPEKYLLWFHHVGWNAKLKSGQTLWNELCRKYYNGVDSVRWMQQTWNNLSGKVDSEMHQQIKMLLNRQEREAVIWRNSCVLYFQTFSKQPIPDGLEKPKETLHYYQQLEYPFAPGIKPKW